MCYLIFQVSHESEELFQVHIGLERGPDKNAHILDKNDGYFEIFGHVEQSKTERNNI